MTSSSGVGEFDVSASKWATAFKFATSASFFYPAGREFLPLRCRLDETDRSRPAKLITNGAASLVDGIGPAVAAIGRRQQLGRIGEPLQGRSTLSSNTQERSSRCHKKAPAVAGTRLLPRLGSRESGQRTRLRYKALCKRFGSCSLDRRAQEDERPHPRLSLRSQTTARRPLSEKNPICRSAQTVDAAPPGLPKLLSTNTSTGRTTSAAAVRCTANGTSEPHDGIEGLSSKPPAANRSPARRPR